MKLSEDTSVRYHTKIDDRLGGPYSVEGLESLVYLKKINPETLIGREGTDVFTPIRESDLCTILFKHLNKDTVKKSPQAWAPPGKEKDPAYLNRKHYAFTENKFKKVNSAPGVEPRIDVQDILGDIRETEQVTMIRSGRDHVRPNRFRISKRTRDFWIAIIVGNTIFLGAGIAMQSTVSIVFGIAGCGLFTFGLLWSMYGVMDNY